METLVDMWWLLPLTGVTSWGLSSILSQSTLANKFLDIPSHRSSHEIPTPRVGGVAIVLSFLMSLLILEFTRPTPNESFEAILGAGVIISLIGLLDDYCPMGVQWRLVAHFLGATWALLWLGGLPPLAILGTIMDFGWFGHLLAAIYLVWLINLYNFMDGINGLAGVETLTVGLGFVVLLLFSPQNQELLAWSILLLAAAVLGFLFWNFPKAKIFMGDSGSGFLGVIFGVLSIQAAWVSPELFWAWIILLGGFIVDATITLIWRILHKERFFEAHRTHAYQLASQKYQNHIPVTLAFGAINLFWLLPIAFLVIINTLDGTFAMIIAYIPLAAITIYIKRRTN